MAREIKYRVWNPRYKDFSYWGFIDRGFCGIPTGAGMNIQECFEASEQFTGLLDKNSKEIYDGDIVKYVYLPGKTFWNYDGSGIIGWGSTGFDIRSLPGEGGVSGYLVSLPGLFMPECQKLLEIIGNIHENPIPTPGAGS